MAHQLDWDPRVSFSLFTWKFCHNRKVTKGFQFLRNDFLINPCPSSDYIFPDDMLSSSSLFRYFFLRWTKGLNVFERQQKDRSLRMIIWKREKNYWATKQKRSWNYVDEQQQQQQKKEEERLPKKAYLVYLFGKILFITISNISRNKRVFSSPDTRGKLLSTSSGKKVNDFRVLCLLEYEMAQFSFFGIMRKNGKLLGGRSTILLWLFLNSERAYVDGGA